MERRGRAKQFRFADSPQIEPLEVHDAGVTSLRLGPDSESRQERGLSRLAVALDREGGAGLPEVVEDRLVDLPHRVANREPGATGRPPTGGAGGGGGPGVGGPEHSATNWRTPSWIGLDRRGRLADRDWSSLGRDRLEPDQARVRRALQGRPSRRAGERRAP